MTEKQIERIRLKIKKQRAALTSEKRIYGGYHDGGGRRYYISDLYMQIFDYKGVITYKRWFDKNFPHDIGSPLLSLYWSIAFFELNKIKEAKIYTIDTAFQNIYIHGLLLDKEVKRIDMYEYGYDMLDFAKAMIEDCKKVITQTYLSWLLKYIDSDEYKEPINKFVSINKLLKDEKNVTLRGKLTEKVNELILLNRNIGN